jgi:hypothetical protein
MGGFMECAVCKKEIPDGHTVLFNSENNKAVCMGCEFVEIPVWKLSLPGENGGYYDHDFDSMAEQLREMDFDDPYEIRKEKMLATKYYALPEFMGF